MSTALEMNFRIAERLWDAGLEYLSDTPQNLGPALQSIINELDEQSPRPVTLSWSELTEDQQKTFIFSEGLHTAMGHLFGTMSALNFIAQSVKN